MPRNSQPLVAILARRQVDGSYPATGTVERTIYRAPHEKSLMRFAGQFARSFGREADVRVQVFAPGCKFFAGAVPHMTFYVPAAAARTCANYTPRA